MRLRFLGKNSTPTNSPTLYATDRDSYVVQGWIVTDPGVLARHDVPSDETIVEVPPALLTYLSLDGLDGVVSRPAAPIVDTTPNGNYVIRGNRVTDAETLNQMSIPGHETCVHVTKSAVAALLTSG
jgi:hypothetical protein